MAGAGGDARFEKTTAEGRYFYPIWDDVVGFAKVQGGNVTANEFEYEMDQVVAFLNKQVGLAIDQHLLRFLLLSFNSTPSLPCSSLLKAFKLHKLSEYRSKARELAGGNLRVAIDYHYPPEFNRMTKRDPRLTFIAMPLKTSKDMLCLELYANEV